MSRVIMWFVTRITMAMPAPSVCGEDILRALSELGWYNFQEIRSGVSSEWRRPCVTRGVQNDDAEYAACVTAPAATLQNTIHKAQQEVGMNR